MGRQIQVLLSRDDEQRLLDLAHGRGFILVCGSLRSPNLVANQVETIPRDGEAELGDHDCYLISEGLARIRSGTLGNNPHAPRPYFVSSRLPYIDWERTPRPLDIERIAQNRSPSRLHVSSDWNYGADQRWLKPTVELYDTLVKLVKKLTIPVGGPPARHVSREFDTAFVEELRRRLAPRSGKTSTRLATRTRKQASSAN